MVACQCATVVSVDTSDSLTRLLMQAARRVRRARAEALAPYGLTPHQGGAFLAIARFHDHHGGAEMKQADLARRMRIAPRSATEVIDALCERGLIAREPSASDRRATSLVITDAGTDLLARLARAHPADEVFAALAPAEREQLAELLRKVLAHTEEP